MFVGICYQHSTCTYKNVIFKILDTACPAAWWDNNDLFGLMRHDEIIMIYLDWGEVE